MNGLDNEALEALAKDLAGEAKVEEVKDGVATLRFADGEEPQAEPAPEPAKAFEAQSKAAGLATVKVQISAGELMALRQVEAQAQEVLARGLRVIFGGYAEKLSGRLGFISKSPDGPENEFVMHYDPSTPAVNAPIAKASPSPAARAFQAVKAQAAARAKGKPKR